jgi:hypothetical protein
VDQERFLRRRICREEDEGKGSHGLETEPGSLETSSEHDLNVKDWPWAIHVIAVRPVIKWVKTGEVWQEANETDKKNMGKVDNIKVYSKYSPYEVERWDWCIADEATVIELLTLTAALSAKLSGWRRPCDDDALTPVLPKLTRSVSIAA